MSTAAIIPSKTVTGHTKKPCKIIKCTCNNAFQDGVHGPKMRVHNPWKKGYRCTVCGKTPDDQ